MQVTVNGETKTYPGPLSVTDLLRREQVQMPQMVSVELNGSILKRDAFTSTTVKDQDQVEFLYFMGGGR